MNWDAIGAVGEVVGGVAVIATLIYLAVQIRDNTKVSASEAFREGAAIWNDVFKMLLDADSELMMRALKDYGNLKSDEKHEFDTLMIVMTNALETNLAGVEGRFLREEVNTAVEGLFRRYFASEGTLEWWQEGKTACAPNVQEWVEKRFKAPDPNYDFWGIRDD